MATKTMAKGNSFHLCTHSCGIFGPLCCLLLLALPASTQTQITVCTNKTVSGGGGNDGETWQIVVTLVMLAATLVAMAREVGSADMLMMLMLVGELACGIVDVKEAVQGLFLFAHRHIVCPPAARRGHQRMYPALFAWTCRGKYMCILSVLSMGRCTFEFFFLLLLLFVLPTSLLINGEYYGIRFTLKAYAYTFLLSFSTIFMNTARASITRGVLYPYFPQSIWGYGVQDETSARTRSTRSFVVGSSPGSQDQFHNLTC